MTTMLKILCSCGKEFKSNEKNLFLDDEGNAICWECRAKGTPDPEPVDKIEREGAERMIASEEAAFPEETVVVKDPEPQVEQPITPRAEDVGIHIEPEVAPVKRGPGRPRKDGSPAQPRPKPAPEGADAVQSIQPGDEMVSNDTWVADTT